MCWRSRFQRICAAGRVERHDELHVRAVAIHEHQVLPHHRRAARAVPMRVLQLLVFPQHLAGGRDAGRAVRAEVHEHAVAVDRGRGRRVAVVGVDRAGLLELKDLHVVQDLAAGAVDRDRAQRMAFVEGRGQPDLIAADGRRRPAQAGDRRSSRRMFSVSLQVSGTLLESSGPVRRDRETGASRRQRPIGPPWSPGRPAESRSIAWVLLGVGETAWDNGGQAAGPLQSQIAGCVPERRREPRRFAHELCEIGSPWPTNDQLPVELCSDRIQ